MVTNNLLAPTATLGLIPSKFIHKFHSANSCPGLHYLVKSYNLLSGIEEVDKSLESLCYKFIEKYNIYCPKIIRESLSCNISRKLSTLREKFMDLYFFGQALFHVEGEIFYIIHSTSRHEIEYHFWLYTGYLIANGSQILTYYL